MTPSRRPYGSLSRAEVEAWLAERGEPAFRADQIEEAVHLRRIDAWERVSNLPAALRRALHGAFTLERATVESRTRAEDGTEKVVVAYPDGARVEAVAMPRGDRLTLCLSSQVGCRFRCAFCATGTMGLRRNLSGGEMVEQVRLLVPDRSPSNVVFMGMGEPLDNIDGLLEALRLLTHPKRLGLGRDRITVSTVGLPPGMERLAAESTGPRLAVSLHAADDGTRSRLVPANRKWPVQAVVEAAFAYAERARARLSFEYVLLGGVNDRPEDARGLVRLLGHGKARLNVIPWNPVAGMPFEASRRLEAFVDYLRPRIYVVTVRRSQGTEINAACGQLALGDSRGGRAARPDR